MAIWKRLKTAVATSSSTISVAFDESTPLDATHTLVAVVEFDGTMATISSTSWGAPPLTGSDNNGSALCLAAFVLPGDSSTNSFSLTLTAARPYAKVVLLAFNGNAPLPTQGAAAFASSVASIAAGPAGATTYANTIAIAAVGLIGQSNGWGVDWDSGFATVPGDATTDRLSVAVRAYTASGATPSSTRSWTTARNARSMMWVIQGTSADDEDPDPDPEPGEITTTISSVDTPITGAYITNGTGASYPIDRAYATSALGVPTTVYTTGEPPVVIPPPAVERSFGPNGTHWPSDTPRTGHTNVIDVACSWSAIQSAIAGISNLQASQGTIIRVAPGSLVGSLETTSSTGTAAVQNVGSDAWTTKVLVVPRDGYGTVVTGNHKFQNVRGVTFARFVGESWMLRDCGNFNLAHTRLNRGLKTYADTMNVTNCNIYEVAMLNSRADEEDSCQYRAANGNQIRQCTWEGCYLAPLFRPVGSSSHLDTLQMFGNGYYRGLTLRDCLFFGSNNCALQGGGYDNSDPHLGEAFVTLDHTMLVSQALGVQVRYALPPDTTGGGGQAINGPGEPGPWFANDSYLMGTLHSTQWNTVTNTRTNPGVGNAIVNGSWIHADWSSMTPAQFDAIAGPEPDNTYLTSIWSS